MESNQKATATDVSQEKVKILQSESNVNKTEITDAQVMSEEDVKFVGELGWLAAAAVTIASIAASV
jgi:hypothetical protein